MMRYRDGDASSFDQLYRRHKNVLFRYILRQCQSQSVAEDLYQDVWMKLIKARHGYQAKAKFSTYLFQIAHNRIIDHYRRQKTSSQNPTLVSDFSPDEVDLNNQNRPDYRAHTEFKIEKLLRLIDRLSSEQKETFLLREEAGLTINEIAQATCVNPETAKSRLRYAVNKLRKSFRGEV